MISILSNSFNNKEKQAICDLFEELEIMFFECYCPYTKDEKTECTECPYKHLCYDVNKTLEFVEDLNK